MKNKARIQFSPFFDKYIVKFYTALENGQEIENTRIHFETEKGDKPEEIRAGLFRAGFSAEDVEIKN